MRPLASCALFLSLACTRDFSVPAPSTRPVLASFAPTSAFAESVLTIHGINFDPSATDNLVQFANKNARAYGFDASGDLLVYVPDVVAYADLNGSISVSNKFGTSDPSAVPFAYQGRGHPYLGTQVGTTHFLHRPPGVAVLNGETVVASTVTFSVMGANGFFAALPGEPTAFAGLPDESAVFAAVSGRVVGLPATNRPAVDLGTLALRFLAASPGSAHLIAAGTDTLGVPHAISLSPATLTVLGDRTLTGPILGIAALDDGRAAVVQASAITLIDPASAAAPQIVAAPSALAGPCALTTAGLAAAFADGTVSVLSIDASPAWGAPISTGSSEPFATLAGGGLVVAGAKTSERAVRVLRLDTAAVTAEHAFTGHPRALYFRGSQILVADDASNAVDVMNPATGALGPRISFSLDLGSSMGCGQGSDVEEDSRPAHYHYRFLVPSRRTGQLIAMEYNQLAPQKPVTLAPGTSAVRGVAIPSSTVGVWVVHQNEIGKLRDDDSEQVLASLPGVQCLLFTDAVGSAAVALGARDASVLRGNTVTGSTTLPGPIISGGIRADGKVVVFVGDPNQPGASPQAFLYTLDALEHGGAAAAHFGGLARYQGFVSAFVTAWGPMLFFTWDTQTSTAGSYGVLLDDGLAPQPAVNADITARGIVRLTPDGYFFVWKRFDSAENLLRVESAYDLNGIYAYDAYRLDGDSSPPAFDSTGEYMYVPIPDQDEIQTFQ